LGFKKLLYKYEEINPGWFKQNIFFKIKNASQKILKTFCFRGFYLKCHFHYAFDDNLSVTHIFIKQIFRAVEVEPPFPLPQHGCAGGGVVVVLYSHKSSLWLWL
jgi:hypothetical protein